VCSCNDAASCCHTSCCVGQGLPAAYAQASSLLQLTTFRPGTCAKASSTGTTTKMSMMSWCTGDCLLSRGPFVHRLTVCILAACGSCCIVVHKTSTGTAGMLQDHPGKVNRRHRFKHVQSPCILTIEISWDTEYDVTTQLQQSIAQILASRQ
jgi:hypothetical protein